MRIALGYPPIETRKGVPQISQNRQFQWTAAGMTAYVIYPVVMAYGATMLKNHGHEVLWADGVAEKLSFQQWLAKLQKFEPDLIAIETKTPVVKRHWSIINLIKKRLPKTQIVLMGDHVTALPQESLRKSQVDWIITGGDYDFMLTNLVEHLDKKAKLKTGFWYWKGRKIINSGNFELKNNLDDLPMIDRKLTHWEWYAYKNSNFFRTPGAYTMFGRDCWWGKCTFCSWTTLFPGGTFRKLSVKKALEEVQNLVENFGVKEIMDDSGTFMTGPWLKDFCQAMIKTGLNRKVKIDCNLRFATVLKQEDYDLMKRAGFRFVLYGLESGEQKTIKKINKNINLEEVEDHLRMAKKAGLNPHLTVMVGYPWEKQRDIDKTVQLIKSLANKDLFDSLQATIVIPYPGTPLFKYCQKKKLLRSTNWDKYDMSQSIIKTRVGGKKIKLAVAQIFSISIWNLRFLFKTIKLLKSWDGVKYVSFQGLKYLGKLGQFGGSGL